MYRAATWRALHRGVDFDDPAAVAASTQQMDLRITENDARQTVTVDGRDVTDDIRSPEVTREIHRIDSIPEVRAHLVELQREFAARRPTVAEGRDMGTVVFPRAKCKVYLEASLDERARRRWQEMKQKGVEVNFERLRDEIRVRDQKTMTRTLSPLRPAEDAIRLDTTNLTLDQVVEKLAALAREAF